MAEKIRIEKGITSYDIAYHIVLEIEENLCQSTSPGRQRAVPKKFYRDVEEGRYLYTLEEVIRGISVGRVRVI